MTTSTSATKLSPFVAPAAWVESEACSWQAIARAILADLATLGGKLQPGPAIDLAAFGPVDLVDKAPELAPLGVPAGALRFTGAAWRGLVSSDDCAALVRSGMYALLAALEQNSRRPSIERLMRPTLALVTLSHRREGEAIARVLVGFPGELV